MLIDDLLLFPVRGIFWIFRELHDAAQKELAAEEESITTGLSELYMMLETDRISDVEFDAQERVLLDRLELIERRGAPLEAERDELLVDSG